MLPDYRPQIRNNDPKTIDRIDDIPRCVRFGLFLPEIEGMRISMTKLIAKSRLPALRAIETADRILDRLERDGADFVQADERRAYLWHHEQLVNLFNHQEVIRFLEKHDYMRKRIDNKMIVAARIIFEGIKRCE